MADKIKSWMIASALSGELLSEDAIIQFTLLKRPTREQLVSRALVLVLVGWHHVDALKQSLMSISERRPSHSVSGGESVIADD